MSTTAQDRSSMDQEEIMNLDPTVLDDLEEIFNLDPALLEQLMDHLLEDEGVPFFACDHFYYTDEYLSNFKREEIQKVDPYVLEQLLQQPLQEEEEQPQQNLEDVDNQNTSLQEELEELEETEPEALLNLMVEYLLTNPEEEEEVEEGVKKVYPAIMGEITKNKSAILPLCRKLLRQVRNRS